MMSQLVYTRRAACALIAAVSFSAMPALAQEPKLDVIYVPTPQAVVDRMLELAEVKSTDSVIDLGCGDGRMIVTAAKTYGAKGFGVDINPVRINEANENAKKAGVTDKVTFKVGNLFDESVANSDVITMYLLTELNLRLRPKILDEMKPGSRVVSHAFNMGEWKPDVEEVVDGKQVYLWHVPAKVQGKWDVKGEQPMTLELTQSFQMVSGKATINGKPAEVSGRLRGKAITLTVDIDGKKQELKGTVEGNEVKGSGWSATKA
ncbi:MAG: class I SAM-dependent methyltransferase [Pseudolabrys sp.]|nr:class I SAM-dependent methyltransferase [Pseudolabrys sp.]